MELLQGQFTISYVVTDGLIRATPAGQFNGNIYSASVRLTCKNLYERKNEKTQSFDTIESELSFKFNCATDIQAGQLATFLKEKIKKKEPIPLTGGIPNDSNVVVVLDDIQDILNLKNDVQTNNNKKAS